MGCFLCLINLAAADIDLEAQVSSESQQTDQDQVLLVRLERIFTSMVNVKLQ